MIGMVTLVGAGPGDPELLTVKAQRAIVDADVIMYDRLVSEEVLALSRARKVYVGKVSYHHSTSQRKIYGLMVREALGGNRVVRLKNGDPFIFGRGGEEVEYLRKKNIPFEIVPGISSALAAPAYAGIPLTHRKLSSSIAILTGHEDLSKSVRRVHWGEVARAVDTLVILMGVKNLEMIVEKIRKGGLRKTTKVAIVEWATTKRQRVILGNLGNIVVKARKERVDSPAVVVIGKIAGLARLSSKSPLRSFSEVSWSEKPLPGPLINP